LEIAHALGFGNAELLIQAEGLSHEVGKMLFTMLGTLLAEAG
jgi:hypothetical protein